MNCHVDVHAKQKILPRNACLDRHLLSCITNDSWLPDQQPLGRNCPNGIAPAGGFHGDGVLLFLTSRAVAPASS